MQMAEHTTTPGTHATTLALSKATSPARTVTAEEARNGFADALTAITAGNIQHILSLRPEGPTDEALKFLEAVYRRYGPVQQLYPLQYNAAFGIRRGVFAAAHRGGPLYWDMVKAKGRYTMIRAATELDELYVSAPPPTEAVNAAGYFLDDINDRRWNDAYRQIVCNCVPRQDFERRLEALVAAAGPERQRFVMGGQTIPGMEDQIAIVHWLSVRQNALIAWHLTMWKVNGAWKITALTWSPDDLIPREALPTG